MLLDHFVKCNFLHSICLLLLNMVVINKSDLVGRTNCKTAVVESLARAHALNRTGKVNYNALGVKDEQGLVSVTEKFVDNFILQVLVPDYNVDKGKYIYVGALNKGIRELLDARGLKKCTVKAIGIRKTQVSTSVEMVRKMPYRNDNKDIGDYFIQEYKVATPNHNYDDVLKFLREMEYNSLGMFVKDFDVTIDLAGSFDKEEVIDFLVKNKDFRMEGDKCEAPRTILDNDKFVGANCLSYMETIDGVCTRQKVYNKLVQMLECQSVRSSIGCHWRDWVSQEDTRLAAARDAATDRGLTRAEITFYVDDFNIPPADFIESTLYRIIEYIPKSLVYSTPYCKTWEVYCNTFRHSLICVDKGLNMALLVNSYNENTAKISGQITEKWTEKWRWCVSNLTLNGNLPIDLIEINSLKKSVDVSKKEDVTLDITGWRYFKIKPDQTTEFKTRLVSRKGCYSYFSASKEVILKMQEKAGFVHHENCSPYLANTTANKNSKVDAELRKVHELEITTMAETKKMSKEATEKQIMEEVRQIADIRKPLLLSIESNKKKLDLLNGYIKSLSTKNTIHLKDMDQGEYKILAAKKYLTRYDDQYRMLLEINDKPTAVWANWKITKWFDSLSSDILDNVLDTESGYLTLYDKPFAFLEIKGQENNIYGKITVFCDVRMNQIQEQSSIGKLKSNALADIEKCEDQIATSHSTRKITSIARENLVRYKDYENLRSLPIGSVHKIKGIGYIQHYGKDKLVVQLAEKLYQAGEDLESKVNEIVEDGYLKIEKVRLNHTTRIKFAVCAVYSSNDWSALIEYNKIPFIKKFDGTLCVMDVKEVNVKGQKRKLLLSDDGQVYRIKRSKLEDSIKPGFY